MLSVGIGHGFLEFAGDDFGFIQQEHAAFRNGFGHLAVRGGQAVDPGARLGDKGFRYFEDFPVNAVEPLGDITGDLHMLLLVLADRYEIRLIEQDIRGHQDRIGKEARIDIVFMLLRLILELGHTGQFAEHGVAAQNPAQLRVGRNMGLDKQGILFGIQAAGNIGSQLLNGPAAQVSGILTDRDRMLIRHKIITVKIIHPVCPVLDGSQIIAQMQVAAGLYAGQHYFLFFHIYVSFRTAGCREAAACPKFVILKK